MPKILTQQQIDTYWRDGCVFPIRVMSESDALEIRERLEAFEKKTGGPLKGDLRHKSHLLFSWLGDLVRQDRIVDAIEDLYGPNLFCWTTNFFIKEANNPAFVSWHQDSTYWGLNRPDVVTAWVAEQTTPIHDVAVTVTCSACGRALMRSKSLVGSLCWVCKKRRNRDKAGSAAGDFGGLGDLVVLNFY